MGRPRKNVLPVLDAVRKQMAAAKAEYQAKRKELERQIAELDREYGAFFGTTVSRVGNKSSSGPRRSYGAVRETVLDAIKSGKGLTPKQIVAKAGLAGSQVHNSLTGLKKDKLVRVKDGLYTAT